MTEGERVNVANLLPYFKFFPRDFEMDDKVRPMDLAHVGLFLKCLNAQWLDGSIPEDLDELAASIKVKPASVKKFWPAVSRCFVPSDQPGRLVNRRLEQERSGAISKSRKNTTAIEARWNRERSSDVDTDVSETNQDIRYGSESESESEKKESPLETAILNSAERIHSRHPAVRRCGIGEVKDKLRTIAKALPSVERIAALEFIDSQHAAWCTTDGWTKDGWEYSKGLDNWLAPTKRRWENPLPEAVAAKQQAKSAIDRQNEIIQRKERERLESSRSN